jgi:hypothetical protein
VHKRQAIRDAIVDGLKGHTACGERVFSNRGRSFFANELPSITVYTESETSELLNYPEPKLKRTISLIVEAAAIQADHIDNELDDLCQEIEAVLKPAPRPALGNLVQRMILQSTEIGLAEKGEQIMGSARMTFSVEYEGEE